jgi:hypothetical protein
LPFKAITEVWGGMATKQVTPLTICWPSGRQGTLRRSDAH